MPNAPAARPVAFNQCLGVTPMNVHENLSLPKEMPFSTAAPTPSFWFRMLRARLAACVKSWADNHAARPPMMIYHAFQMHSSSTAA
jgi:hypothetical protein